MKRLLSILLFAAAARAQWQVVPSTGYPALEAILNGKGHFQIVHGPPNSLSCVQGKDSAFNDIASTWHLCIGTGAPGTWATIPFSVLLPTNNLSDVVNAAIARTNLGMGTAATANLTSLFQLGASNTVSTGVQDFSAATNLRVPNAAGYTPTVNGHFGYDTTANSYKGYVGAAVKTFAFLDSNITGNAANVTGVVAAANGGNGVANTATHTLGTSPQNWATLGTGIVKNTTTTGAISNAAFSDVVLLFGGGACVGLLKHDGSCVSAGAGTVTVVGSANLTSTAFLTGGGSQTLQSPSATSTLDASGNAAFAGAVTAASFSTGAGAVGALIGAEQSGSSAVAQFAGVPGLYFSSTDHLGKYLNSAGTLAGVMVAPAAARTANQFVTNVPSTGIPATSAIVGADLPLPTASTLGGAMSKTPCPTGNHIDSLGTNGIFTCSADATVGGSVNVTTKGDLQGYNTAAARIPVGTNGQTLIADSTQTLGLKWSDKTVRPIKVLLDAGEGSTLTSGAMVRCGLVDWGGTIQSATITADTADSAVVDVRTVAYASYTGPGSSASIAASAKPTLASAIRAQDSTLTGWTTALAANTYVCFSMTGPTVAKWVEVDLKVLPN